MPVGTISYHFVPHVKSLGRPGLAPQALRYRPYSGLGKKAAGSCRWFDVGLGDRKWRLGRSLALGRLSISRLTCVIPCPGLEPIVWSRRGTTEIVTRKCL